MASILLATPIIASGDDEPNIQLAGMPEEIEHHDIYSISGTFEGLPAGDSIHITVYNWYLVGGSLDYDYHEFTYIPAPHNRPSGAFVLTPIQFKGPGTYEVYAKFTSQAADNDQSGTVAGP